MVSKDAVFVDYSGYFEHAWMWWMVVISFFRGLAELNATRALTALVGASSAGHGTLR